MSEPSPKKGSMRITTTKRLRSKAPLRMLDRAGIEVIAYIKSYIPIGGEMQQHIFNTVSGVINARGQAGAVAFLILVWAALQCFTTLICATNRAWGTAKYNWWRLPLKSLVLLGITAGAILLGMAMP